MDQMNQTTDAGLHPLNEGAADGKTVAIISYITLIGFIIALIMNSSKRSAFAAFHIRQSLGIMLTAFVLSLIGIIPILGWIVSILGFLLIVVMWIMGLVAAVNGEEKPVFLLGNQFQDWFRGI